MKFQSVKQSIHDDITMIPQRATTHSAGFDFALKETITLKPNDTTLTFTDVKCELNDNEVLLLFIRSSIGVKKHLMLANGTGVIDSDYYNNAENEGNIGIALHNYGTDTITLDKGERVAQGIILNYIGDGKVGNIRSGGFGSSGN